MNSEAPVIVAPPFLSTPATGWQCKHTKFPWPPKWPALPFSPSSSRFICIPMGRPIFYGFAMSPSFSRWRHVVGKFPAHQHVRGGHSASAMPLARGLRRQPAGVSPDRPDQLYVRPPVAAFHPRAFAFSCWLPLLLVWLLFRLGYDKRALTAGPVWLRVGVRLLLFYSARRRASGQSQSPHQHLIIFTVSTTSSRTLGQPKPLRHPVAGRAVARLFLPPTWPCAESSRRVTAKRTA